MVEAYSIKTEKTHIFSCIFSRLEHIMQIHLASWATKKKLGVFMQLTIQYYRNFITIIAATFILAACATTPPETTSSGSSASSSSSTASLVQDGVYVGDETIEMLAVDVPDRVFFSYDSYALTSAAQSTLSKQAKWLKANPSVTISVEGHADERGTREYNLALGDRRANAAKDYLMSQGISSNRVTTISYGKERPVKSGSNDTAWAQNRRSVTVRTN
jgi:peptidoglycan-associated lipoprotein